MRIFLKCYCSFLGAQEWIRFLFWFLQWNDSEDDVSIDYQEDVDIEDDEEEVEIEDKEEDDEAANGKYNLKCLLMLFSLKVFYI